MALHSSLFSADIRFLDTSIAAMRTVYSTKHFLDAVPTVLLYLDLIEDERGDLITPETFQVLPQIFRQHERYLRNIWELTWPG